MKRYWDTIFGADYHRSIWVEQENLGKEVVIEHRNHRYVVKIPERINKSVVLRLRGLGKIRGSRTGELFLRVWLNKGDDICKNLWLSETSAWDGADKRLELDEKTIIVVVPPKSRDGLTIRIKNLGQEPEFNWRAPFLQRRRGNLLVRLFTYPDTVTPQYGSFEMLSTDSMALEGWVYRRIDEIFHKIGQASFPANPLFAGTVADRFNERGWSGVAHALVDHLKLAHLKITFTKSSSIALPGSCQKTAILHNNLPVAFQYEITIKDQFLDNPFFVAAIAAHELCHVIYSERIDKTPIVIGPATQPKQASLEEERTVDLLVFLFKIGEFQLRVARNQRLTLGYFNQEIFERIQVIVSRKLNPA